MVALPCEEGWELENSGCVCVWPPCGSGDKGEDEYPNHGLGGIGEVSIDSKKTKEGNVGCQRLSSSLYSSVTVFSFELHRIKFLFYFHLICNALSVYCIYILGIFSTFYCV